MKLFRPLLTALEQDRARVDGAGATVETYRAGIIAVRGKIKEAQVLAPRVLKSKEGEVFYFREVWPRIYGQLFYYQKVHGFLVDCAMLDAERIAAVVRREEMEARCFFRAHREFWLYYTSKSPVIEGQFTRAYSRECIFDPLCMVIDQLGATLASYKAAWGAAYMEYSRLLKRWNNAGAHDRGVRYEWKETKSAAVEWIKSQAEAESIYIDGKPATTVQLKEDFEQKYNVELKGFDLLLYATDTRKKDTTPYLTKLIEAFKGRKTRLRK